MLNYTVFLILHSSKCNISFLNIEQARNNLIQVHPLTIISAPDMMRFDKELGELPTQLILVHLKTYRR